jgi:hypothetical protein
MKRPLLTLFAAFALTACATGPSAYGPALGSDLGFRNTKIENDRFRVSYTARTADEAHSFALLRAAQIAEAEGYSHFKVIGGQAFDNGQRPPISSNIGIGIGGGYGRGSRTHLGLGVHDVARVIEGSKVTENIEIILQNSGSRDPNVYDAKSVAANIRPAVFK